MSTREDWISLLVDTELAKSYYWLLGEHTTLRIPSVESVLVSGLLIRSMSLLDEVIDNYIQTHKIPAKLNRTLFDRLCALHEAQLLVNYDDINAWRLRRNVVGHEITEVFSWEELKACHVAIFRELSHLKILYEFPQFEVKKTIKRVSPSSPDILVEQNVCINVSANGLTAREICWRLQS